MKLERETNGYGKGYIIKKVSLGNFGKFLLNRKT